MALGRLQNVVGLGVRWRRHPRANVPRAARLGSREACAGRRGPQIATFTGHSLHNIISIRDAHYLGRDAKLTELAIMKLEKRTKL